MLHLLRHDPLVRTNIMLVIGIFLGTLALARYAPRQQDNRIFSGQPVIVDIDADSPAYLSYTADSPQRISVMAHSLEEEGALDTVIEVTDAQGNKLAYVDDGANRGDNVDAQLDALYLPEAGIYTLRIDSFNGVSAGRVEVLLEANSPFMEQISHDGANTIIQAELPAGARYAYTVEGEGGQQLIITAKDTGGTLDPFLRLYAADGTLLAENDDHTDLDLTLNTLDSRLEVTLPTDGSYTITVSDFSGKAGTFILSIVVLD